MTTAVLTQRVHPVHAARHRAPARRSWPRRAAAAVGLVFAGSTFVLGLAGWAAMLAAAL